MEEGVGVGTWGLWVETLWCLNRRVSKLINVRAVRLVGRWVKTASMHREQEMSAGRRMTGPERHCHQAIGHLYRGRAWRANVVVMQPKCLK